MDLNALYHRLSGEYQLGTWWPAESRLEIMVGAILVQRTNWKNAAAALEEMRRRDILSLEGLQSASLKDLQEAIRVAGFPSQKAERIKGMIDCLIWEFDGDIDRFLSGDTGLVRERLLALKGVGKETADAILLFAGDHVTFVAASYVSRIFERTGVLRSRNYDEIRDFVLARLPPDPKDCSLLYSLLVHHAQCYCRSKPRCHLCPLSADCSYPQEEKNNVANQDGEKERGRQRD